MGVLQDLEQRVIPAARLNTDGVPSASIAILHDGKVSAHVITSGREDTDTVYQACSISKAITALAVSKLVDEGRISYDTKVVDHLDRAAIDCLVEPKTEPLMQEVTVGMLLSHTSGLSQHGFPGYAKDLPTVHDVFSGKQPSNTPEMFFLSFPGAQFSYSGGGFTVLQLVLESVTGMDFAIFMRQILLEPLGMSRSWYSDVPPGEKNFATAHYTAHTETDAPYHRFVELAAAGLWTTPSDLLKATSAIQDSLYTNSGFLTQDTARKMLTQVTDAFPGCGMGLGWAVDDCSFAHAGDNFPGYTTYFFGTHGGSVNAAKPDTANKPRNGVAVMTNSVLGHQVAIKQIISAILYLKGWDHRSMSLPLLDSKDGFVHYSAPDGTPIEDYWKNWIGKWDGAWQLIDDGGPALAFGSFAPIKLSPAAAPVGKLNGSETVPMFVVDGMRVQVELVEEGGERAVKLLQVEGGLKTLRRT